MSDTNTNNININIDIACPNCGARTGQQKPKGSSRFRVIMVFLIVVIVALYFSVDSLINLAENIINQINEVALEYQEPIKNKFDHYAAIIEQFLPLLALVIYAIISTVWDKVRIIIH